MSGTRRSCRRASAMLRAIGGGFAYMVALTSLAGGSVHFVRARRWRGLGVIKLAASGLSTFLAAGGIVAALLGLLSRAPGAVLLGLLGAAASAVHIRWVTAPHHGFEHAFGPDTWARMYASLKPAQRASMLSRRWAPRLPAPASEPVVERDVAYWNPGANGDSGSQPVLCDVWSPPHGVDHTGVAMLYVHGGAWVLGQKDFGTRSLFRHLAAQGHVVLDVEYRLCPQTDMLSMVGDIKRAVAWTRSNAARLGIDPERIVLAGGSAGGHLALLAAYTPSHELLTPPDLLEHDTRVRGVVSFYGVAELPQERDFMRAVGSFSPARPSRSPADLAENQLFARIWEWTTGADVSAIESFSTQARSLQAVGAGVWSRLIPGAPPEQERLLRLLSPMSHVGLHCPPTLIVHGAHDSLVPVAQSRELKRRLEACGVPVVLVELPQTEHGFDLMLSDLAPAGQAARYDLERFLAVLM